VPMLHRVQAAAVEAELLPEVLVNDGAAFRHRSADETAIEAAVLLSGLGDADTLLFSPHTDELRAYNRLALLSRAPLLSRQ